MLMKATYIWLDGAKPTNQLRSKTRIIPTEQEGATLCDFPDWSFDGSSTYQAEGDGSDLLLIPVHFTVNPLNGSNHYLVLCEVMNSDGTPHKSNTRAKLRELNQQFEAQEPWFGFEQEYTLFKDNRPLGWPDTGYPAPQGPFYCGVGATLIAGRDIEEAHMDACIQANLMLYGTNAEVMPGQWEFQIGYRGSEKEKSDPITISDHLWLARWLLYRICEKHDITVSLDPKPIKGDWNGAGKHTNFSTKRMRNPKSGKAAMEKAIENLKRKHDLHIAHYGHDLDLRLTGAHETADINSFSSGVSDRGASIRIPGPVAIKGYGYLEDRRPGANADPYTVAALITETVCADSDE